MSHHRRRRPRLQSATWWTRFSTFEESIADKRAKAGPCDREAPYKALHRKRKPQVGVIEDLLDQRCLNPIHKIEHAAAMAKRAAEVKAGRPRWSWSYGSRFSIWQTYLRFPKGGRTDIVECRACGATMPRIIELPKVAA